MKKLMIALAIVAIASVAQAELLATWTLNAGGTATATENGTVNMDQVTFGDLTRTGLGVASTVAGQFSSNGFGHAGPNSISFLVTINSGYQITGASLNSTSINGSNTGPGTVQWQLNGVNAGASLVRTSSAAVAWNASIGDIGEGANTLAIVQVGTANVTGGATSTGGSFRINNLTMSGDVASTAPVPEPATMGLLGLGALAMVLRRKMSK